jgi:hypothetical protein
MGTEDDGSDRLDVGEVSATAEATQAGARAIPTVDERVDYIVGMMDRFEWVTGKSGPILAARWGLAPATVAKHAAEASRRCIGDADEARRDITVGARKLLRRAVQDERPGDFAKIADVWASVSGAKAAEKRELSGPDGKPIAFDARTALLERITGITGSGPAGGEEASVPEESDASRSGDAEA